MDVQECIKVSFETLKIFNAITSSDKYEKYWVDKESSE